MTGYLIRRFIQMGIVVLVATMAIYALLNLAPGGPLSGLNVTADRKSRYSDADKARLEAYLGLDKPLALRYLTWLIGEDWLGAEAMYLGLKPPKDMRFYAGPGIAYATGGYTIWVEGETVGTEGEYTVIKASKVWIRPKGKAPEDVVAGKIIKVVDSTIKVDVDRSATNALVKTDRNTMWEAPAPERPEGPWLNIAWLTGPYGLLGKYAHFHGDGKGILRFDFDKSWSLARGQPVAKIMLSRLNNTVLLMFVSIAMSLLVAIPIGIYSAVKQYSKFDYVVTTFAFFGSAMPVFWLGLMMILIFSIKFKEWGLPYMPAGGVAYVRTPPAGSLAAALSIKPGSTADRLLHLVMPSIALSLLYMAGWSRYMRAAMLDVLRQDYVRTARAKGLTERVVIVKHAMRNALIPLVTIVVFTIPAVFGGATITETIFSWKGMGRLYFDALSADDWPIVMAFLFLQSVLTVIATLVGDILYTVVDPRIRYD